MGNRRRLALAALALAGAAAACGQAAGPPAVTDLPSTGGTPARLGATAAGSLTISSARVVPGARGATVELRIDNAARATGGDDALVGIDSNLGAATLSPPRVPIPAGDSVTLAAPASGPTATLPANAPLVPKETAALTLVFARAGDVSVFATVG